MAASVRHILVSVTSWWVVDTLPPLPGASVNQVVGALLGSLGVPALSAEAVCVVARDESASYIGHSVRVIVAPLQVWQQEGRKVKYNKIV